MFVNLSEIAPPP